jgi:hypothetical protein
MQVYKIAVGNSFRFIRAMSAIEARLIAAKVWGLKLIHGSTGIGQQAPDIGARGYDLAVNRLDLAVNIRAMQKAGSDSGRRAFYMPSEAKKTRTTNKANELIALLFG